MARMRVYADLKKRKTLGRSEERSSLSIRRVFSESVDASFYLHIKYVQGPKDQTRRTGVELRANTTSLLRVKAQVSRYPQTFPSSIVRNVLIGEF